MITICCPDQQPDVEGTARSAEHAEQRAAITRRNLLETMTALVVPASGEACTTKVQLIGELRLVQFFKFTIATVPVCRSRFRSGHRNEMAMHQ